MTAAHWFRPSPRRATTAFWSSCSTRRWSRADAADSTFATDNFQAGELIGEWALATMGEEAANARIATLDLNPSQISVDYLRNQGFMHGLRHRREGPDRHRRRERRPHRRLT
jgi:hypothetical protein